MKKKGKLTVWNDEKGYGFISPPGGGDRVFVHITAFGPRLRRPELGDDIAYSPTTDSDGRPRAAKASIVGVKAPAKPKRPSGAFSYLLTATFLAAVAGAVALSRIPPPILFIYLALSAFTFAAYALDKRAAKTGDWRISENTLHLLALAGGWPGAQIAQGLLRHKTQKQPFRGIFWATVVLNCGAFAGLFTAEGQRVWRLIVSATPWG
ncbi:MAG: cold shock and DUF1294 domain-containing protein [Acidobacteria bacterium]|nr:cold shock and DUF1294 domain-containing protein [Acidobacteriota bacterium]